MNNLINDIQIMRSIFGDIPKDAIRNIEGELSELDSNTDINIFLQKSSLSPSTLLSALRIKDVSSQIDVKIHTLGILLSLPYILESPEKIISTSLGAGNTGREFDLMTDKRVAEFTFIKWQGGSETIRQNRVFKAYFHLSLDSSKKKRQLFLTGKQEAITFLKGGRALESVLQSKDQTAEKFFDKYDTYKYVGEFYEKHSSEVEIIDLFEITPFFRDVYAQIGI